MATKKKWQFGNDKLVTSWKWQFGKDNMVTTKKWQFGNNILVTTKNDNLLIKVKFNSIKCLIICCFSQYLGLG